MKISQLVAQYFVVLPIGCMLDEEQVTRSLREAVRQYCGYAHLVNARTSAGEHIPIDASATAEGEQDFILTASELAIIKPLWHLYLERESAETLEASRSQGADPWGRSVTEVQPAITDYEISLPQKCFSFEVRSF